MGIFQVVNTLHYLEGFFSSWYAIFLFLCGFWSAWITAPAFQERKMPREAAWARRGGLFYVALSLAGFFGLRGLLFLLQ